MSERCATENCFFKFTLGLFSKRSYFKEKSYSDEVFLKYAKGSIHVRLQEIHYRMHRVFKPLKSANELSIKQERLKKANAAQDHFVCCRGFMFTLETSKYRDWCQHETRPDEKIYYFNTHYYGICYRMKIQPNHQVSDETTIRSCYTHPWPMNLNLREWSEMCSTIANDGGKNRMTFFEKCKSEGFLLGDKNIQFVQYKNDHEKPHKNEENSL